MKNFDLFDKYFKFTFWLIIIFEIFSFWGHSYYTINQIIFIIIVLATLGLSLWKLKFGFWIACAELFIGSFGYLFALNILDFRISIRLGIFVAVFIGWLWQIIKTKKIAFLKSNLWQSFILFITIIILGVIVGLINHNSLKNIFFDANSYLYFGLIFVAFTVINSWQKINIFLQILFASVTAIAIKTIFLLFYFSHQANDSLIRIMYTWVRDTRTGEIAPIANNYYRIFFQSHIWSLFSFIILLLILILLTKKELKIKNYLLAWAVIILSSINLIISFSRSFWLALGLTLIMLFIYLIIKEKFKTIKIVKIIGLIILIGIIELGFITLIVNIKLPSGKEGGVSVASLIKDRATETNESAVISRYQLLKPLVEKISKSPIIGHGFGKTVTFKSEDPRLKNINNGVYTTYAFEWGYLDILLKIGIIGLLAYFLFIYKIFKNGVKLVGRSLNNQLNILVLGLLFCLIALLITHLTTPYLNHPLGIFLIIISAAIFYCLGSNPPEFSEKAN